MEHLEAEVKGLLGQLEELAWNLPPGSFSPTTPDLFGDGERLPRAGVGDGGRDGCPPHRCGLDRQGEASGQSWEGITPSPAHPQCSLPSPSPPPPPPRGGRCSLASERGFGKSWHSSPGSPPSAAGGTALLPPPLAIFPPQSSWSPFRSLAGNHSCATTEPSEDAAEGLPPAPPGALSSLSQDLGGGWGLGAGPRGAFSAPEPSLLFQMALEHRSQSCPATGNDTPVVQLLWAQSGTWWPAFLSFVHNKSYSLGPLCLLTVTPIATAPSLSTPTP